MKKIKPNEEFQLGDTVFTYTVNKGSIALKKIRKENSTVKESKVFTPPTLADAKDYCDERKNGVDADAWHNFYSSKGWMVGRNKMVDWKAAIRTWEKKLDNKTETTKFVM